MNTQFEGSYEVDMEESLITECLDKIRNSFKTRDAVRDSHPAVIDLLSYTGNVCWTDYCEENGVEEWGQEAITQDKPKHGSYEERRLEICRRQAEKASALYNEQNKAVAKLEEQYDTLSKKKAELEVVVTMNQFAYDDEGKQTHKAASQTLQALTLQVPHLEKGLRIERQKRAKLILERDLANSRVNVAANQNALIQITINDPCLEAEIATKIAGHCLWKLNTVLNTIASIRIRMEGNSHDGRFGFEDSNTSAYESDKERLERQEEARNRLYEVFSACQFEYEIASAHQDPERWWPDFPEFTKELYKIQQSSVMRDAKRAQERQMAAIKAREEGLY